MTDFSELIRRAHEAKLSSNTPRKKSIDLGPGIPVNGSSRRMKSIAFNIPVREVRHNGNFK